MNHWATTSTYYHIYPLGFSNAPQENQGERTAGNRLIKIVDWLDFITNIGCDALYLGPVFESSWHGYDTADYYQVDSRLGTNDDLVLLSRELHNRGMRLVLDGVFNHVGRNFWAFRDLQVNGFHSGYKDWFVNVDFSRRSPSGDNFDYATWEGHYSLPKLNLHHPAVRSHLLDAVKMWIDVFQIDGLRLDAADCVEPFFWQELRQKTSEWKNDFWLMGEIIHGDYRQWANPKMFDSVTNYTAYKGMWSSLKDGNYFEIAYTLDQQFDRQEGTLKDLGLYNFVDNHDVSRVASLLNESALLFPLYLMLFTIPGIPSIYYGSEFGVKGRKEEGDFALRRSYELTELQGSNPSLAEEIRRFAEIRKNSPSLLFGDYQKLHVQPQQFAFKRSTEGETTIIILNSSKEPASISFTIPGESNRELRDVLNGGELFTVQAGVLHCQIPPKWGRILKVI